MPGPFLSGDRAVAEDVSAAKGLSVKVTEICVDPASRRIRMTVEMPDPDRFLTSQVPHLPKMLFRLFPHLAHHKCDNGNGYTFRRECRATEIPHLFEHLIIELQAQAQPTEVLRGETQWNWRVDPRGRFYVYVDYENELLAIGAIRLAERIILALDRRDLEEADTEQHLARLRELARLGRELASPAEASGEPAETRPWSAIALATEAV